MDYPIKTVRGNWFRLHHTLEKVVWTESNKTIVDYIPQDGDKLTVTLQGAYTSYEMENVTIEGNVLKYENNGTLPCGVYDIVINVVLADGKRLRSHQDCIVKVVKTNKEASIPDYVEFGIDTYVLDGAVFMYVPGSGGSSEQVQADWEQDDSTAVDFIKNKPTIPSKTSDLTNDSGFLTSETDPTVPAWAKQPTKPTYTAQEVGALPANTPIPSEVTESTVSGWGFTKNTGTYSIPSGGIPKTDLSQDVKTSLEKADNAIQKAAQGTTGLLKPDGTVDNSTYLTQHQDISGKANTSDLSNVAFSGSYNDLKNRPIIPAAGDVNVIEEVKVNGTALTPDANKSVNVQVPTNTNQLANGAGYITSADIAGKEDKVAIITPTLSNNAFNASVGNYYKVTGNASAIDITLVTPSETSHLTNCIFLIDNSNGVGVSFHTQNLPFYQAANFAISSGKVYEVNALFNGTAWYLTQVEMEVQS